MIRLSNKKVVIPISRKVVCKKPQFPIDFKATMYGDEFIALKELLDHMREDEAKNFEESSPEAQLVHVHNHIELLDEFVDRNEMTYGSTILLKGEASEHD